MILLEKISPLVVQTDAYKFSYEISEGTNPLDTTLILAQHEVTLPPMSSICQDMDVFCIIISSREEGVAPVVYPLAFSARGSTDETFHWPSLV